MTDWTPRGWRRKPARQQPSYPDPDALQQSLDDMAALPPLVTSWEVEALKSNLASAARGEMFLLQGGDCAESFADCAPDAIAAKLKILLQMSLALVHGARKRVVRVGRIAGQYAKPRSSDLETRDGVSLPSYRGDVVNAAPFTLEARTPDPSRMLRGYERASLTLNFIRALADGGFADLHHPEYWDLSFVRDPGLVEEYERIVGRVRESIDFLENVAGMKLADMGRVDFYTSHEALHLPYEEAQTRTVPRRDGWYNLATHFPWLGMRTAELDGAHLEYFRGIRNPVAVKVGPGMTEEWLTGLLDVLHPDDEPGRLMLIHRMGADHVQEKLPPLIETVRRSGKTVLWCADPMHGNTESTADGTKTRRFDRILREVELSFDIHESLGTILGGIHFELTGEDVTECVGGAGGLNEEGLKSRYTSLVDPRLNYGQALEMSLLVARRLGRNAGAARADGTGSMPPSSGL